MVFSLAFVRQKATVAGSHFDSRLGGFLLLKTQSMTDRFGQLGAGRHTNQYDCSAYDWTKPLRGSCAASTTDEASTIRDPRLS
jgi:hypothetical protein